MNTRSHLGWKRFQKERGLIADGIPGMQTLREVLCVQAELEEASASMTFAQDQLELCRRELAEVRGKRMTSDDLYIPVEHFDVYPWARPPKMKGGEPYVFRDPLHLIPAFAIKVDTLFRMMDDAGFSPSLQEAGRTFARAEGLNESGRGIKKSMHCYGAAVDIIDAHIGWGAGSGFWHYMRDTAEELGMFVLYYSDGSMQDRAHIQAIPVSEQKMFRAMNDAERAKHVATRA